MSALGWLLADDQPLLSTVEPRPWPDAPDDFPGLVAVLLRPLVRALLLAGYRSFRLDLVRSGVPPGAATLTANGLTGGTAPTLGSAQPSTGAGIVIAVDEMIHDHALSVADAGGWLDPRAGDPSVDRRQVFSHAVAVPASPAAPWTGLGPGGAGEVVIWSGAALVSPDAPGTLNPAWTKEILERVFAITTDIQNALAGRATAGPLTPLSGAGLLWLLNPLFWYAQDATFPGAAFQPDVVGMPVPELAWPAVVSPTAGAFDPVEVLAFEPRPATGELNEMVLVAAALVGALAENTHVILGPLIQSPGWTRGDLQTLLSAAVHSAEANALWRRVVRDIRVLAGDALAERAYEEHMNWLELLLELAELGTITPAGYPAALVGVSGQDALDAEDIDPVLALYYPAAGAAPERVVLEVRGVAAVTISATARCEIGLLDAFAWDYLVEDPPTYLLTLVVVAGPGVSVVPGSDRGLGWDLEVIRAWSYTAIPPRGTRIQPELLLMPIVRAWEPSVEPETVAEWNPGGMPMYAARVYPLPHGVAIEYPLSQAEGETPKWRVTANAPEGSGDSRIAYDFAFGHVDHATESLEPTVVSVSLWVSPDVDVTVERFWGSHASAPVDVLEWWRLADAGQVPLHGVPLPHPQVPLASFFGPALPEPEVALPAGATRIELPPLDPQVHPYFNQIAFMVDFVVGMIPVVGDVVDIIEVSASLYTGKDKWGRPMTVYEQLLLAGCLLVPGVSNTMVRQAVRQAPGAVEEIMGFALRLTRGQNLALLRYVDQLRGLPSSTTALLDLAETSRSFNRFDLQRQAAVARGLRELAQHLDAAERVGRTVGEDLAEAGPGEVVDLLTDRGQLHLPMVARADQPRAFWLPALQEPFQNWCRSQEPPRVGNELDVLEWITATRQVPQAILEILLGNRTLARLNPNSVALRRARISARWGCLAPMARRITDSVANAADYERPGGLIPIRDAVLRLAAEAEQAGQRMMFSSDNRLLEFAETPDDLRRYADLVVLLLTRLSPDGNLDAALPPGTMLRLLGGRLALEPGDLAEALLRGMAVLDRQVADVAEATNVPGLTTEAYLRFAGHESYFKDLLTQAGHQQSSLFEVRVACEEYARLWGPGRLVSAVRTPEDLFTLQSMYPDGKKGPDLVRLFDERGELRLQIVESKSWARAWLLGEPGGSALRQIERFISFVEVEDFRFNLPNGVSLPTHREIIVRINVDEFARLAHMTPDAAKVSIDNWLLDLQGTLDGIKSRGWTVTFQWDPLYVVRGR
jgi:hypothetical protein